MISIYALVDPRTNEAKYVGQTSQPLFKRLYSHTSCTPRAGNKIYEWNMALKRDGIKPVIIELDKVPKEDWIEAEQFWIACLRFLGANLTNDAIGGPGATGHIQSKEERERKRISNIGKKRSEQAKRNISIGKQKLMRERPDIREKYAEMARNLPRTPEGRKKTGDKLRNRPISEDHKQRIRDGKPKLGGCTSKYFGVYLDKARSKWAAKIRFNMRNYCLGRFEGEVDAARAYDKKAFELLGEHAKLNFPADYSMFSHAS